MKGKANSEFDTLSLHRRVSSTRHMMYHYSDPFLSNFSAYLRSHLGGKRSEAVIVQRCSKISLFSGQGKSSSRATTHEAATSGLPQGS